MGVLIVDDSQFMRIIISNILQNHGIEVAGEASDGEEAVIKYQQLNPSIVTMDLTMKGVSGIEAVEDIMKLDPNARIIVCSAMGQKAVVSEAIKAGAKGFIIKPFEETDMINEVKRVMNM